MKLKRSNLMANCNPYLSVITHKLQSDLFDYTFRAYCNYTVTGGTKTQNGKSVLFVVAGKIYGASLNGNVKYRN